MAKRKATFRDSKEYQQFLKKVGYVKTRKIRGKAQNKISEGGGLKTGYADAYYADTGTTIKGKAFVNKDKIDERTESPKIMNEIRRKENLVRAMNMPAPRDLSDDVPERTIDQSNLISSWEK